MPSREMRVNLNIEELPNIKAWIADLTAERDAAVTRADAAEQAVQRVRDAIAAHRISFQPGAVIQISHIEAALDGAP